MPKSSDDEDWDINEEEAEWNDEYSDSQDEVEIDYGSDTSSEEDEATPSTKKNKNDVPSEDEEEITDSESTTTSKKTPKTKPTTKQQPKKRGRPKNKVVTIKEKDIFSSYKPKPGLLVPHQPNNPSVSYKCPECKRFIKVSKIALNVFGRQKCFICKEAWVLQNLQIDIANANIELSDDELSEDEEYSSEDDDYLNKYPEILSEEDEDSMDIN
jgi:hypothetical protein